MLDFLRRHQKYFFLVITIVIIISFSFFGTYSTITDNSNRDQVAFNAINGRQVKRSEVDEMANFISTDNTDKLLWGGAWGPNFLNSGVIRNDFLQTGLAEVLAEGYFEQIKDDLATRNEKEKRYSLYKHPEGGFVSVANAWSYFAPGMYESFELMRTSQAPATPAAFQQRVKLYLQEQNFPPHFLRQVLKQQERQYSWISPDPYLDRADFSLFGYHTFEDWFGSRFSRLVSEFIINAAIIAEQKGYHVSKEEALSELIRNNDISFQQNKDRPSVGVANSSEYFREQLSRLGMDTGMAVKIWQQVMLFQKYFHDVGNSVFLDTLAFQKYNGYAKEYAEVELYQIPKSLQLKDFKELQKFETYLNAVTKRSAEDKNLLSIPKTFLAVNDVSKKNPELVQKRYVVEIASIDKRNLSNQVSLKDTWNWEVQDAGWATLKKEFPELASKNGVSKEERHAALDSLTDKTRSKVDAFAAAAIVDEHADWLQNAIKSASFQKANLNLRLKGGKNVIAGLNNNPAKQTELLKLLDEAKIGEISSGLTDFTADNQNYYAIRVIEKAPELEIVSFAEANRDGTLELSVEKTLEAAYPKIRESNSKKYQKEDGSWKNFADVKEEVAKQSFEKIVKAVKEDYTKSSKTPAPQMADADFAAAYRFFAYMRDAKAQVQKNATVEGLFRSPETAVASTDPKQQWLLEKATTKIVRNGDKEIVDQVAAFRTAIDGWSTVEVDTSGRTAFYQVKAKGSGDTDVAVGEQTRNAYGQLSDDAQRMLMRQTVKDLKAANALSLDYLTLPVADEEEIN